MRGPAVAFDVFLLSVGVAVGCCVQPPPAVTTELIRLRFVPLLVVSAVEAAATGKVAVVVVAPVECVVVVVVVLFGCIVEAPRIVAPPGGRRCCWLLQLLPTTLVGKAWADDTGACLGRLSSSSRLLLPDDTAVAAIIAGSDFTGKFVWLAPQAGREGSSSSWLLFVALSSFMSFSGRFADVLFEF